MKYSHDSDGNPAAVIVYALAALLLWAVIGACVWLFWPHPAGAQPVAPCATPGVPRAMPTAAQGRPMDARPTYGPALRMPGGRP